MALQDAVRGDHLEVTKLLIDHGGKIFQDGNVSISCIELLCFVKYMGPSALDAEMRATWACH